MPNRTIQSSSRSECNRSIIPNTRVIPSHVSTGSLNEFMLKVVERMAQNLEVAGRQRTHLNGRAARLRSALELLYMVRPHDTGVILHLARFYMLYQMDLTQLVDVLTYLKRVFISVIDIPFLFH